MLMIIIRTLQGHVHARYLRLTVVFHSNYSSSTHVCTV